ncbi:signal transduction histidine kinase [Paucimonas lemoignei]|uniref:histidine kinase n=1 Tax=Paucimonas lemoignei TaxID=29443 RepID=A0A4V2UIZ1_PAULE|nr:sensor histidine kinase [Paucimonas lemoignei]TCS38030.1 signal transduction histidine kinase [Paucimonas lemoignei]
MPNTANARLSDFILNNLEPILQAWEDFARTIEPPALTMDDTALRNHAIHMLKEIAGDLERPQNAYEQSEKSKGKAPRAKRDSAAETHAASRLLSGYTIEQLVSEYRALRASVLQQWAASSRLALPTDSADMMRFNEAIDQALAESVARYAKLVKQSQNMFLAILGHDLRNPLGTIITGASFIMQATDIASKYIVAATRMFNSGQRMNKLIGDLIDFTRSHLGSGLPVKPKQANLAIVCMNVVEEMRTFHPERMIEFDARGDMGALLDEDRISQVFSNLIGNALQYGRKNGPVIVTLMSTPDNLVVTVNNQGEPIDPPKLATIFEPLVRLAKQDTTDCSRETSLGIGLFIAREIVHAHSGTITVTSEKHTGTTFTISLPRLPTLGAHLPAE